MRITSSHRLFGLPEWIQVPRTKTYQAESDQKDKMRHAMDDNGIPSKEIHERHRERAITAEEAPDDTKPLQYVPKSQTDRVESRNLGSCIEHQTEEGRVVEESEKEVDSDLLSDARRRPDPRERIFKKKSTKRKSKDKTNQARSGKSKKQIERVHEEDILKTAFRTRYEFEFTVMPFGLTNTPASKEEYEVYLKLVLELLKKEKLFVKFPSYYQRFIANFSEIAKPLTSLTQKNKKYEWDVEQEEAFQTLKSNLCDAQILSLPDGVEDFVVYCDASNQGLGCVLMQRGKRHYLYGTKSVIYTDHKSLQNIFDQKELNMHQKRWIELFSDYECEIRYHPGKENVVADALTQSEAFKHENVFAERLHGLDQQMERKEDESLYFMEYMSSVSRRSPVLWAEIGKISLIGPELVQEMTDKVVLIKEKLKAARDHQKSYADTRRKPLEFKVGDRVLLKVSPYKGAIRFRTKGKLASRYVGPSEILERIGPIAYQLRLLEELSTVHDTFGLADANLHVPLDEIKINKTLHFVEEPVEIMDREVRSLKRSRISLVKVYWNSKRSPEFAWEREDHMKSKYPHLIVDRAVESAS
ncbi:putative reverse transcriptase domain-containing protein [Tanacetum coccineum]